MFKPDPQHEMRVLEELFLDQLEYKIFAVLSLQSIRRHRRKEILSFMEELSRITKENIALL